MTRLILIFFTFFLISCKKDNYLTCEGVEYIGELSYKNGKLYTGTCVTHHKNLSIRSIQNYLDGKDHGKWKFFHDNGVPETVGSFEKGKKIGVWKYFSRENKLRATAVYDNNGKILSLDKTEFY